MAAQRICIAGAGSIGCYVGGMLAAAGRDVAMLARPRIMEEIRQNGLRLTGFDGSDKHISTDRLHLADDPAVLGGAGIILVTVKSADTAQVADLIARHASQGAVVVSLQNGVGNVAVLRGRLPGHRVLGGMVPFNVIAMGEGRIHCATSGDIMLERDAAGTAEALSVEGLSLRPTDDISGVRWGKLLLNLNNALNALSGIPLRAQLAQRQWRTLFADQMAEGLIVLKAARIRPVSSTPLPAGLTTYLLRLPDGLFNAVLGRTMKIDANARSSMWEDLQRGRRTEVDYLQGVIVGLAAQHGLPVPLTERVMALVKAAEAAGQGSPGLLPAQIRG
ncbi:MAG: 2-dehydropantoate 2-reductase [Tardiphaga sp.]